LHGYRLSPDDSRSLTLRAAEPRAGNSIDLQTGGAQSSRMKIFTKIALCSVTILATAFVGNLAVAADLASGEAKGTYAPEGAKAVTIDHAATFVDQKDDRKPTILLLTDKKLPTEKWKSEFDLMLSHEKFNGVLFWLDNEGKVFRTDTYENGRQASVSGVFELKLDGKFGKELTGSATSGDAKMYKLEVTFHATVK
jgi:hypothetical protein